MAISPELAKMISEKRKEILGERVFTSTPFFKKKPKDAFEYKSISGAKATHAIFDDLIEPPLWFDKPPIDEVSDEAMASWILASKESEGEIMGRKVSAESSTSHGIDAETHSEKALHRLCDRINGLDALKKEIHSLSNAGNYVCKRRQGDFRNFPFMGGEEFRFNSAYVGKSGSIIYVFKPAYPVADFQFFEINALKIDAFPTFKKVIEKIVSSGMSMDMYEAEYKVIFEEKDQQERQQEKLDNYGNAWGSFA